MSTDTGGDRRSPWYEPYTRPEAGQPAYWLIAATTDAAPARSEAATEREETADGDWATEAIFDYYNS